MESFAEDLDRFRALIQQWHKGHPRSDQIDHCIHVCQLLQKAFDKELSHCPKRRAMCLTALGHDLYEDSEIDPKVVVTEYGQDVHELIEEVTERNGVIEYVERVATGSEEARLIKLCDGIDNYQGLIENRLVQQDPAEWLDVVRKQMEPMFNRLVAIPFQSYPKAGEWLLDQLETHREAFWTEVRKILDGQADPPQEQK